MALGKLGRRGGFASGGALGGVSTTPHNVINSTNLNSADKSAGLSISEGNQTVTATTNGSYFQVRSVDANTNQGVVYFETTLTSYAAPAGQTANIGIATASHLLSNYAGSDLLSVGIWLGGTTDVYINSAFTRASSTAVQQGDVIGVKIDFPNKLIYVSNITRGGGFNPATSGAGISFAGLSAGPYFINAGVSVAGDILTFNTGLLTYSGTLPVGADNWLATTKATYAAAQRSRVSRAKGLVGSAAFPAIMGAPPTVNNLTTGQTTTINPSTFVSVADAAKVNSYGLSNFGVAFQAALSDGVQRNYYDGSSLFYAGSSPSIITSFSHTGSQIDFVFAGSSIWQLLVNGQLVASSPQGATVTGSLNYIQQVIFSGGATRNITLIFQDAYMAGFFVSSGDTVVPANPYAGDLSMGFQGDSYLQQSGSYSYYGVGVETALGLGCSNIWMDPVGGTGFIAENASVNGGVNTNFTERLGLMTPAAPIPDLFVTMGGINDLASLTAANVQAHVSKLRGMFPSTVLIYTGPWCPIGTQADNVSVKYRSVRNVIKQALMTDNGPWVFIDNLLGVWYNSSGQSGNAIIPGLQGTAGFTGGQWQTGTGHVGATTGTGNGDTWVQADAVHPTLVGVDGLRQLLDGAAKSAIAAL